MHRFTKTFIVNHWYRRISPGVFNEVPASESQEGPSIDAQVQAWVLETGHVIIHPGQMGMHTSWHGTADDPYQIKCLTFGLTVLYQKGSHDGQRELIQHTDPVGLDAGASAVHTGPLNPRPWGGDGSPVDRTGTA